MLGWGSCRNSPRALRKAAPGSWQVGISGSVLSSVHMDMMGNHIKPENAGHPAWLEQSWHLHGDRQAWHLLQWVSEHVVDHGCSAAKSCPAICDPMDGSTPGFLVLHHLPEFIQTQIHWLGPLWAKWCLRFLICCLVHMGPMALWVPGVPSPLWQEEIWFYCFKAKPQDFICRKQGFRYFKKNQKALGQLALSS